MKNYILVIDEGTTGVRALIFDRNMQILNEAYKNLELVYPGPAQVEVDGEDIYNKTVEVCREVVAKQGINPEEIECVGVTTQRATWGFWDKNTGKMLRNMVTWQDGRGIYQKPKFEADPVFNEKFPGVAPHVPGYWMPLVFDKIRDDEPEFAKAIQDENVLFGHIDAYLVWRLTKGAVHATSYSQASATGIFLSQYGVWTPPMLEYLGLNPANFPEIREESSDYGVMDKEILGVEIPIYSSIADQQAALFSQNCQEEGSIKCTMGTGAFFDINIGDNFREVPGLNAMIAWQINGHRKYLFEGMSSTAGACLEWAKNQLKLVDDFGNMEAMSSQVEDSAGLYFIPALAGIGGDTSAKGAYMGIRPNISNNHMMRATLEGIAYGSILLMELAYPGSMEAGREVIKEIKISGGVSKSNTIGQVLADVTGAKVIRPKSVEATALGSAEAAAIKAGWMTMDDVEKYLDADKVFEPSEKQEAQRANYANWKKAVERTMNWDM